MKITTGNFGNALPRQVQPRDVGQGNGQIIAQGLGQLANTLGNIGERQAREAEKQQLEQKRQLAEQKQQQEKDDKLKFSTVAAKVSADINVLDDELVTKVNSNELDLDGAVQYRQKRVQEIRDLHVADVPASLMPNFEAWADKTSYESAAKLVPVAKQLKQKQELVGADEVIENALKLGDKKQAMAIVDSYFANSNIPQPQYAPKRAEAANRFDKNAADRDFAVHENNNEQLAKQFNTDTLRELYPDLTAEQATAYTIKAKNKIEQNNKAALAAQKQLENDGNAALSEARQMVGSGVMPDADTWQGLATRVAGTPAAAEFSRVGQIADGLNTFIRMPPDQREAILSKMESAAKNEPQSNPLGKAWELGQYRKAHDEALSRQKNNPTLDYEITTGKQLINVPATSIAVGDPKAVEALQTNIKAMVAANESRGITGTVNPLSKENQLHLKQAWQDMPSEQRMVTLQTLMKGASGNPQAARDMIRSVAGSADAYRMAASLAARGDYTQLATNIIKGQQMLEQHKTNVPKLDARAQVAEYLKDIVPPDTPAFNMYLDAATAYYAYMANQKQVGMDSKGKPALDKETFRQAIATIAGDKYEYRPGWTTGKVSVLRPRGVTHDEFEKQFDDFNAKHSRTFGERDYFKNLKMMQNPKNPNQYYFLDGGQPVTLPYTKTILMMDIR